MPRIRFTKSAIDALAPEARDVVYWDAALPGFGLKITPKGRKVFIAVYRVGGGGSRLRKYTIGPYGRMTLVMARAQAQKIFAARLDGRDPATEKKETRRRLVGDRIDDLVETFIQEHVSRLRTARPLSSRLRHDVVAHWAGKSVHEIKKRDVIDLIQKVAQRNAHAAHKVLKILKTFFRWCVGRAIIESSPAEAIPSSLRETKRDRVLNDDELKAVLNAARELSGPFGAIVELLALTGQRREEVAQMQWEEIDDAARTWTISALRSKNGRAHMVHLSDQAWVVIQRFSGTDYVLANDGRKNFQAFSKAKKELDNLSGVRGWCLHDLRRTVVSGMARLGVPPHVADKILNHQSGTISGVAAVYQRHEFQAERKNALDLWASHVGRLRGSSPHHLSAVA